MSDEAEKLYLHCSLYIRGDGGLDVKGEVIEKPERA